MSAHDHSHAASPVAEKVVRDPVCGMTVDPKAGKPTYEQDGHAYQFCSERSREKYLEATDPVCGLKVYRATARHMAKHEGERFYFCSPGCHEKFEAAPAKYLVGRPAPEPMPEGTGMVDGKAVALGNARMVADLGIDEIRAEVLPENKARIIRELQAEGRRLAMAGDDVNDAPALAQADVGIALGTGVDLAIESAGFTLVKGDLNGDVRARRLSLATMRNIRQNLFSAMVYSAVGVPVAAGVLYPFLGILISPSLPPRP